METPYGKPRALRLDLQTGCHAGRLDTLVDRNEAFQTIGSPYYQLTRLCNMKRGEEWREQQKEKFAEESDHSFVEDYVDAAEQEVMPLFGIAVQDHPDSTLEDLQATLQSIVRINYPAKKMKIVISTFAARGLNAVMNEVNFLQEKNHLAEAIFHVVFEPRVKDREVFQKLVQAHYFVNVYSGAVFDKDVFMNVHKSLNYDLEKVVMFENDRGYSIIRKQVATGLYLQFNNYEDTVNHIREISQEKNVYQKI